MKPQNGPFVFGLDQAWNLIIAISQQAEKDCADRNLKPVAICIVDAHGDQLCAVRMDGTKTPSIKTAHDKAVTAVLFERNTAQFTQWSAFDLANAMKINSVFCGWGGGVLILSPHDGSILGAVGVSNRTPEQDDELAALRPSGWSA